MYTTTPVILALLGLVLAWCDEVLMSAFVVFISFSLTIVGVLHETMVSGVNNFDDNMQRGNSVRKRK